jgi:hypothetical protein
VVVAINKATSAKSAGITLAHAVQFSTMKVYTLTASGGAQIAAGTAVPARATNAFYYMMPAQSVSVLVPVP